MNRGEEMIFEKDNIITKNDDEYIILATSNYNGKLYLYVNKLINRKASNNYKIFKIINNNVIETESDVAIINKLLPFFEEQFAKDIEETKRLIQENMVGE